MVFFLTFSRSSGVSISHHFPFIIIGSTKDPESINSCIISVRYAFFIDDASMVKPMTPIGRIISNLDVLRKVKAGDILSLYTATG